MPSQVTWCVCSSGSRPNQPLWSAPDTVPADPSGPWARRESTSDRPAGPHSPGRLLSSYPPCLAPCRSVGRSGMHTSGHFLPARGPRAVVGRADRKSCPDHLKPKDTVYPILAGSFARRQTAFCRADSLAYAESTATFRFRSRLCTGPVRKGRVLVPGRLQAPPVQILAVQAPLSWWPRYRDSKRACSCARLLGPRA